LSDTKRIFPGGKSNKKRKEEKMLSKEEISRIKAEVNLIAYLEAMGLRPSWRKNGSAMFFSPLRVEKNPSFYVSCRNGVWLWKDWGTGESGDIIKFLQLLYGIDFLEVLRRLKEERPGIFYPSAVPVDPLKRVHEDPQWVRRFYEKRRRGLTFQRTIEVKKYFFRRGVNYYPEMGCIQWRLREDGRDCIGIPIPFPRKIRGIEWRELEGDSRKTWGKKTLWVLKRDPHRILVAESILDALAGERVLNNYSITLCSINGVTNVTHLEKLFNQYKPEEVILALDADEPGRIATRSAVEIAVRLSIPRVVEYEEHIQAEVKDLHELLMKKGGLNDD
jgi:hypothetical protein